MSLSKSKYTRFCQCPKMLWLDTYRPELAETFPDLSEKLLAIRANVHDLLDVFRNGYVYDRAMEGSFSIKKVLPALFPNDPNLDYHNLADVHNGGEATDTFLALRGMEREERDKLRQSLLAYCKLDTMAMVMLWQFELFRLGGGR